MVSSTEIDACFQRSVFKSMKVIVGTFNNQTATAADILR